MIDGRNFFDHHNRKDIKTYENIKQVVTGRGNSATG